MNMTDLPFLSNIGFMLTYQCSVACPHCIVEAGPHRKDGMALENALRWISEASVYRDQHIKGLALTGGEPFLDLERLKLITEHGKKSSFIISAVTNAFWATSMERAFEVLSEVPTVQMVSLSTDAYHLKSIPFDNIKNGIRAAKELGVLYNVAVCTDNEESHQHKEIIGELLKIADPDAIRTSITFPSGRAAKHANTFHYHMATEAPVGACTMVSSPVVFPDGKVMACIGPVMNLASAHPLNLGNLNTEPLSTILDRAEMDPVIHAIRVWGPHKIVALLREKGLGRLLPREYIAGSPCDVCYKLFSNGEVIEFLASLSRDEEFMQKVAYGRAYYLNENTMAEILKLTVA